MQRQHYQPLSFIVALLASWAILGASPARAAEREFVRFRLTNWKTAHIHSEKAATSLAGTLDRIGCEVKQGQHAGHYDVRYRCMEWKSISLTSHDQAHQWERWLKSRGFQTEHKH